MLMLSRRSLTAYGGIGVTTPTDGVGEAILTTVMAGTAGIVRAGASVLAGAASTAVAGGDTIITIIPVAAGIPAADTGEAADIGRIIIVCIRIVVLQDLHIQAEVQTVHHAVLRAVL